MKMISRIAGLLILTLLLGVGCKNNKNEVPPTVDSTQILPSGKVDQIIVSSGETFTDTGVTVTIKGKGFDPHMKNNYFLFVMYQDITKIRSDSTLNRVFKSNETIKDTNLVSIDESSIVFKLPKYSMKDVTKDSAFLYFAKHKANAIFYDGRDNTRKISAVIASIKEISNLPVYKLLKDTLYINKKYSSINKEIIQGSYSVTNIKIMVEGLEYFGTSGFFLNNQNFNSPLHETYTISMVATYDKFYLPDGSYSFEIYERNGHQRKFVEETGKTKIYIKNVP